MDSIKDLESKLALRDAGITQLQKEKLRPQMKIAEAGDTSKSPWVEMARAENSATSRNRLGFR